MKTLLSAILGLGLISGVAFAEDKPAATTAAPEATATAPAPAEHKEMKKKKTKKEKKDGHGEKGTTEAH